MRAHRRTIMSDLEAQTERQKLMQLTIDDIVKKYWSEVVATVTGSKDTQVVIDRIFNNCGVFAFGVPFDGDEDSITASKIAFRVVELAKVIFNF